MEKTINTEQKTVNQILNEVNRLSRISLHTKDGEIFAGFIRNFKDDALYSTYGDSQVKEYFSIGEKQSCLAIHVIHV